jgi:hypothetical protein
LPTDFQELSFTSPQTARGCLYNSFIALQMKNARDSELAQAFP